MIVYVCIKKNVCNVCIIMIFMAEHLVYVILIIVFMILIMGYNDRYDMMLWGTNYV